jgi:competence protein CoiA
MTQSAWTRDGLPVDAADIPNETWEALKSHSKPGDFLLPCCKAHAVLKTSINGVPFFAHVANECATAPETIWHQNGKAAVLAALAKLEIPARDEVPGKSPSGEAWQADVLFTIQGRTIAIELQKSYQHLRDFIRRQERYSWSGVECYWLTRHEQFITIGKATSRLLLKREYNNVWPDGGIGTGSLPELPVAMLETENRQLVQFGLGKAASVPEWLNGIINRQYKYHQGSWNLG